MTVVERKAVGFLLGANDRGQLDGVRCYHSKNGTYAACDCIVDDTLTAGAGYKHRFVLSDESRKLKAAGKLTVDEATLDLQAISVISAATTGGALGPILNRHSGIGEGFFDYMQAHGGEGEEEEKGEEEDCEKEEE